MPGDFRRDRGGLARVFYFFTHEAAGALGTRHSPRPLRADEATTRTRLSPRERGGVWFSSRAKFTLSFRGARKGRARNPFLQAYRGTMDSGFALTRAPERREEIGGYAAT